MSEKEISLPTNVPAPGEQQKRPIMHHPDGPNVHELQQKDGKLSIVDQLLEKTPDELLQWENIFLPSKGLYYQGRIPEGKIQIKPMGLMADKIMATGRLATTFQSIDWLFKHHVKFPAEDFDPLELLMGDRTFLLFCLRGITHGNKYEFSIKCTNDSCKENSIHEYDLNELQNNIKEPKHLSEPVKVILPGLTKKAKRMTGNASEEIWANVRFLRGSDARALEEKRRYYQNLTGRSVRNKGAKQKITLNQVIEDNLRMAIVSINGEADRSKIEQMVERMAQSDTAAIRRVIDEESPGMNATITITCPHCETEIEMELPITESFFRPETVGGV